MEPADLNSSSSPARDDARLEAWLRQPAAPLPDEGFTQRVLVALPPRTAQAAVIATTPPRTNLLRWGACGLGGSIGIAVAYMSGSPVSLSAALQSLGSTVSDSSALASLMVATAAALYALRPRALMRLVH